MRARYKHMRAHRLAALAVETPLPHFRSPFGLRAPAQLQEQHTVWSLQSSLYISLRETRQKRVVPADAQSTIGTPFLAHIGRKTVPSPHASSDSQG